jgi:hypothetical protein
MSVKGLERRKVVGGNVIVREQVNGERGFGYLATDVDAIGT